ncbi:hypothetical protein EXIGLDRAFT_149118 [Exidia glandulosa HHB12029]|uniref:Uncharacterized protein n=1 Tax=Exidia glandulosa HHB12029 TaxID=1314781 RepID=A0A165FN48_EXIGL|nr:hypothetical protein EXIGLDRAFT_149118 [Exidia glandulosa HHB12029]
MVWNGRAYLRKSFVRVFSPVRRSRRGVAGYGATRPDLAPPCICTGMPWKVDAPCLDASLIRRRSLSLFLQDNGLERARPLYANHRVFSPVPRSVQLPTLDVYTSTYRIAGTLHWNFERSRGRFTAPIGVLGQRLLSVCVPPQTSASKQTNVSVPGFALAPSTSRCWRL